MAPPPGGRAEHARLLALVQELSTAVVTHEYWATLPQDGTVVTARSALKHHPDAQPATGEAAPAAAEPVAA